MSENPFRHVPPPQDEDRPDAGSLNLNILKSSKEELSPRTNHAKILIEQIESGHASRFDSSLVHLLEEISQNKDKSKILSNLVSGGLVTLKSAGSKIIGILGALEAGSLSQQYVANKASAYLSGKFLVDPNTVKNLPSQAATSISESTKKATEGMNPEVVAEFKDMFNTAKDAAKGAFDGAKNLITDAGGGDILKSGSEILSSAKDAVVGGTGKGVDYTIEQVNQMVLQPTIDTTSEAVGWTSYLPAAAIGYLLSSAAVGGISGVLKERKDQGSFDRVQTLIDKVWSFDKNETSAEADPRTELIGTFNQMRKGLDQEKYSFTKEEWLSFASAVREARCSLLREKTQAPDITLSIEQAGLSKKTGVVEQIILAQHSLAEEDASLATEILSQYDTQLTNDLRPFEKRTAFENKTSQKFSHYSKVFVQSAIKGTGLPTLWKAAKVPLRLGRRLLPF